MMNDVSQVRLRRDTASLARRLARSSTHEADRERLLDIARELENEASEATASDDASSPDA